MIKNYDQWLSESNRDEFYLPADQWNPIDEHLLDYFDVELDEIVCLGTPGIGWSSDSQPTLYKLVRDMYMDVKPAHGEKDSTHIHKPIDNSNGKIGIGETGKRVYYVFFDKPFKIAVASIKGGVIHRNPLGQIYILKSTAEDLIHQFRGRLHSRKYGLNENHTYMVLSKAEDLIEDQKLADVMNDCEEGKYTTTQIVPTAGATSYVGVSTIQGSIFSNVYQTSDAKVAAIALVMESSKIDKALDIINALTSSGEFLNYAVFAGDRKMTPQEAASKYNIGFDIDNSIPALTSTPVRGMGTWYS